VRALARVRHGERVFDGAPPEAVRLFRLPGADGGDWLRVLLTSREQEVLMQIQKVNAPGRSRGRWPSPKPQCGHMSRTCSSNSESTCGWKRVPWSPSPASWAPAFLARRPRARQAADDPAAGAGCGELPARGERSAA
jgi:hypothetical protein